MIKICHLTSAHRPFDTRIYLKECKSLSTDSNFEVHLVQCGDDLFENDLYVHGLGKKPNNKFVRAFFFARKVYKYSIKLDCDLYHIHDPELLRYARKLRRKNKIVIYDSHEFSYKRFELIDSLPNFIRLILTKIYTYFENINIRKCNGVICVTPSMVEHYKRINPCVAMVTNYPISNEPRLNNDKHLNVFGCMGELRPSLNIDNIIKAIKNVPNSKLILIGSIDEKYLNILKSNSNWDEQVEYKGFLNINEGLKILSECSAAFALLSYTKNTEGKKGTLGNNKLFEAMSVGTPAICTDFDIWKGIIAKYNCGICVNPNNIDDIARAIRLFHFNKENVMSYSLNALNAVKLEFNWETQKKMLFTFYYSILKESINDF